MDLKSQTENTQPTAAGNDYIQEIGKARHDTESEGLKFEGRVVVWSSQSGVTPEPRCSSLGANLALGLRGTKKKNQTKSSQGTLLSLTGRAGHLGAWV